MSLLQNLRRRLGWKLFLSYMLVILVGVLVMAAAAEFIIPNAFNRHMGGMVGQDGMMEMMGMADNDVFAGFQAAFNETLLLATLTAILVSVVASFMIARRIVAPVRAMTAASRRIAAGNYAERVAVRVQPAHEDELDQLASSFNTMAAELEQTEAMRRQLIGDVAHELRTPLTTIKGSLEGLIDGVLPADPATFQQVYLEADRLQRLVNDLQELSRVEAGAYTLEIQQIHAGVLIQGLVDRMRPQFVEKGVALHLDLPLDLPHLPADADRLTQVLTNLLGNALQYTPESGSVKVQAALETGRDLEDMLPDSVNLKTAADRWLIISVHDTGAGIAPEHLAHVFDRFYRVDKSRSRAGGGSGIGLTIARHLVEAHGGRIWVVSAGQRQGSTFRFCIPADAKDD